MSEQRINAALEEATDTRDVNIEAGALASVPDVFRENFGDGPVVIVADGNTFEVAGKEVQRRLEEAGYTMMEPYVFPAEPPLYAEYSNIEKLRDSLREHDAIPVAVGSGTLNDIVKRSSHECERPYMCVGTAASMDGYTAFGASIEKDGLKQTLSCPAPRAVVADLEILQNAPENMTASGYADLLGKVTSGADWLVADALEVEKIDPTGWSLVQDHLRGWTDSPAELRAGDQQSTGHLVEGLIMSGLGMQSYESSRTASGAEHQFSHLWEMEGLGKDADPPLSHGFKVGVGSVAIAALYELLLERDLADLDIEALKRLLAHQRRDGTIRAGAAYEPRAGGRRRRADPRQVHQRGRARREAGTAPGGMAGTAREGQGAVDAGRTDKGDARGRRLSHHARRDRARLGGLREDVREGADDPQALHRPRPGLRGRPPR